MMTSIHRLTRVSFAGLALVLAACASDTTAPVASANEQAVATRAVGHSTAPTPTVYPQATGRDPAPGSLNSSNACTTLGHDFGFKIQYDPSWLASGGVTLAVTSGGVTYGSITVQATSDTSFNWTSSFGIDAVAVHGGSSGFNVYDFSPVEATSGEGYKAPMNSGSRQAAGLSNASFCFDVELASNIGVTPQYTRTWSWNVSKTASTSALTLSAGQTSAPVSYNVTLGNTSQDSDWKLTGTFTVTNPTFLAASISSYGVTIDGVGATLNPLTCPSAPFTLAAGASFTCAYKADMDDASSHNVTVTVATSANTTTIPTVDDGLGHIYGSGSVGGTENTTTATFGDPTSLVDDQVDLNDSLKGTLGHFSWNSPVLSSVYTLSFGPYQMCGVESHPNTATFTTNSTATQGSATANVDITVTGCTSTSGCTLTLGYWKTHSQQGPAPYDDAWKLVGSLEEQTIFFKSAQTWLSVFNTAPAGNAYYTLAHQYMAATINQLNGASSTPAVTAALASATTLFNTYTPAQVKASKTLKDLFTSYVAVLDSYNQGLTGPGHCSE